MNRYLRHGITLIVGILAVVTAAHLITGWQDRGGVVEDDGAVGSGMTGSAWFLNTSSQIQSAVSTWGLKIPGLASAGDCLVTDASGVVTTGACGGAGGGSNWLFDGTNLTPSTTPVGVVVDASSTVNGTLNIASSSPVSNGVLFRAYTDADSSRFSIDEDGDVSADGAISSASLGVTGNISANGAVSAVGSLSTGSLWNAFSSGRTRMGTTTSYGSAMLTVQGGDTYLGGNLTATGTLTVTPLTSALTLTGADGAFAEYAGTSCTNQMVTGLSALGVATCETIDLTDTNITAGDALTITANDIDFDGGATPSGDLGGTWASPSVSDDSHAHTGTTLSSIDISADTNLSADGTEIVLTGDALSLGTELTFTNATSTTSFFSGLGTFTTATGTTLRGFGLFDCDGASNAVTWDTTTGKFGCNTITGGGGGSNWLFDGSRLTPSTTVGIGVFASSTIGGGTGATGLSINGGATTTLNGVATAATQGFRLQNVTPSTAGVTRQYSPALVLSGTSYRSIDTSSNVKSWSIQAQPQTGSGDLNNTLDFTDVGVSSVLRLTSSEGGGGTISMGGTSIYSYSVVPGFDNGAVLGSAALRWSDLFLAEGGVINWDNGDATLTQVGNMVTLAGADLTVPNATSTTSFFSALGTFTNSVISTLLTALNVTVTGLLDVGGGSLEVPNGTGPTVDATGETAVDTTSDQFVYYGASAKKVLGNGNFYPAFTYATTTAWTGTTTIPLGTAYVAETWNGVQCFTDAGTISTRFGDGTNWTNVNNSSTTVGTTVFTSNNTFTAGEKRYVEVGTPASSPTKISCTISKSLTAD